jgi:ABC-type transport system involved in multi-copper enzyme maturation permease subunit
MTTDQQQTGPALAAPAVQQRGNVSLSRVLLSEWIKLRSLRSTVYTLVIAVFAMVGIGVATAFGIAAHTPRPGPGEVVPTVDPTGGALSGLEVALVAIATLGVLSVATEYGTGTIKATVAAVPRRTNLVWAKALVVGSLALIVTLCAAVLTFAAASVVLSVHGTPLSLTTPGLVRALVGSSLYLGVLAAFMTGFGWLLRSTAGALAVWFGVWILPPLLVLLLPESVGKQVEAALPSNAGATLTHVSSAGVLSPWAGFALFCVYTAVLLVTAAVVLRRRDA